MRTKHVMLVVALTAAGVTGIFGRSSAQAPLFKRTVLQKVDVSVPGREAVQAIAEFSPGGATGRHTHPGEEVSYVLEGTVRLDMDGKPPVTLKAGDAFFVEAGKIHAATNAGQAPARVLTTYVVQKDKPLTTPAP